MKKLLNNKTLNLPTGNKIQFLESFNKLGFDTIIYQSRNVVKTISENRQMDLDVGPDVIKKNYKNVPEQTSKNYLSSDTQLDAYDII